MRRVVALVCAASCAGFEVSTTPSTKPDCTTSHVPTYVTAGAAASVLAAGWYMLGKDSDSAGGGCSMCVGAGFEKVVVVVIAVPIALSLGAASGLHAEHVSRCKKANAYWNAIGSHVHAANQLARIGSDAARAGTCRVAMEVAQYLDRHQPDVHVTFVRTPAVERCLEHADEAHAEVTRQREACNRSRAPLRGGSCFDPTTLTIETMLEASAWLQRDRAWRLVDRAAQLAFANDCVSAKEHADRARATVPDLADAIEAHPQIARCIEEVDRTSPPVAKPSPISALDEDAWALFMDSRALALTGNCAQVKALRAQITDRAFHEDVFIRLPSIARCLAR